MNNYYYVTVFNLKKMCRNYENYITFFTQLFYLTCGSISIFRLHIILLLRTKHFIPKVKKNSILKKY